MREIKFRAWRESSKSMMPENTLYELFDIAVTTNGFHDKDGVIWEQFTGLTDKNGVEIYEGDIVKCKASFGNNKLERFIGSVTSEIFKCSMSIDGVKQYENKQYHLHQAIALEIIGNIHQNKDLLS